MSDLISRQYAIKRFGEDGTWLERQGVTTLSLVEAKQRAVDLLESFPSADRPTEWIPTSERLPDIGDTYLVTVMVGKEIRTDVADSFGSYIDGFWNTFNDWIEDEECHVIAWMPLPEPYKGGDTE